MLLEFAEGDRVLRGHQHRRADHRRARPCAADGSGHQVDLLQGHHPAALLHRQCRRRAASGSGCSTRSSASSTSSWNAIGLSGAILVRQPESGHPDHRDGQCLEVHGLHRAADLRRPADHPDQSLYEAASLDGATGFKPFRRITLPLLRPVLVLVLITSVVGSFQVFDTVAVTTKGGPGNASSVIQLYIYDQAFRQSHFGYASCDLGPPVPHPHRRRGAAVQVPARPRVGPGVGGGDMTTTATPTGRTGVTRRRSSEPQERFTMGRAAAWTILALVIFVTLFPFYWMLRTALSNGRSLNANSSSLLPGRFHLGRLQARARTVEHVEEAQAEGGSGAAINFWLYLRNSVIVSTFITVGQVVLQRDGRLRLLPDALARPRQGLRALPCCADDPADLHHAAELPASSSSSAC